MDFNNLNTKADAEAGSLLHFTHPQLRHRMYTGEGADDHGRLIDVDKGPIAITALVRGMESPTVKAYLKKAGSSSLKAGGPTEDDGLGLAIALVVELNGVFNGEAKVPATKEGLKWFFGRSEDLALQVIAHARDRSNFFRDASPD